MKPETKYSSPNGEARRGLPPYRGGTGWGQQFIALASFILAAIISITALFLPPQGVIDYSVLVLIAQLLILVCTIFGVKLPNVIKKD